MKAALLHLNLSGGPEEANIQVLERAIGLAAEQGADWVITPETAVQGYFFARKGYANQIPVQPAPALEGIRRLVVRHRLTLFLGCAEQDEATGKYYNSCLVIGPEGRMLGSHRKIRSHGGDTEAWAAKGESLAPVPCAEMTAGILICADSWFVDHARMLKDRGADVIIVPAAWAPGEHGPEDCWERCSRVSGLPVWVCNQTGNQEMLDFSAAQSVVVADGATRLTYSGLEQGVLLFDWDTGSRSLVSTAFTFVPV
ncbi:carbon-nitrogen hydrolase family protein [Candidatus Formimonas warabiya]|uniref:CN hydrolase domain-containing protein n=1 Tax=Formimonas warabiya TaxID=1761012 RepID=A0A3G1KZC3_FORW1|nr:carbon-nitrogen hydrolase family protein [Candidatus Formimonas warabiya]ATW27585.1 hypothetical protein DCMF_25045 [Candidatus Formimonas warabiya]